MCRFLIVRSKSRIQASLILEGFAKMAERSRAPDGDWQGDGWGISWLDEENCWRTRKSVRPIWEETAILSRIPESHFFLAHARSASFPRHKNRLDFNQPFVGEPFGFVFNGLVRGISLQVNPPGSIGSQKIWSLLKGMLVKDGPQPAILSLLDLLRRNSKAIQAFNLGLCDKKNIYAWCSYSENPEYYNLQVYASPSLAILSSEAFAGYAFRPAEINTALVF